MLPVREIRDPLPRPSSVVPALIAVNVAVFLYQLFGGDFMHLAFVPRALELDPAHGALTMATSMFLHAGWLHLLGNMLFLHVFGPSVENTLGPRRFVALYALAGIGAALGRTSRSFRAAGSTPSCCSSSSRSPPCSSSSSGS